MRQLVVSESISYTYIVENYKNWSNIVEETFLLRCTIFNGIKNI